MDIFYEVFGYCLLLINFVFVYFIYIYGKLGFVVSKEDWVYFVCFYWFIVEFGLVRVKDELKIYGGGILFFFGEIIYVLDSDIFLCNLFIVIDVLRIFYCIDIM